MIAVASNIREFERRCVKCGESKPVSEFYRDGSRRAVGRGNLSARCKTCMEECRPRYEILPDNHPDMINGRRSCTKCGLEKALNQFPKQRACPQGRQRTCKRCFNDYRKSRKVRAPKSAPMEPTARDYRRRYKFKGLTAAAFKAMFDAQHGKCGICEKDMGFLDKETCVDHDHATGLIRGVLCGKCNRGLGCFGDAVGPLKSAITYLEKHGGQ